MLPRIPFGLFYFSFPPTPLPKSVTDFFHCKFTSTTKKFKRKVKANKSIEHHHHQFNMISKAISIAFTYQYVTINLTERPTTTSSPRHHFLTILLHRQSWRYLTTPCWGLASPANTVNPNVKLKH